MVFEAGLPFWASPLPGAFFLVVENNKGREQWQPTPLSLERFGKLHKSTLWCTNLRTCTVDSRRFIFVAVLLVLRPRRKNILQPSLWLLYQASVNQSHPPVTWNHFILSIELASCEISEAFAPVLKTSLGRLFSSQMLPPEPTKISVILHISCYSPQMLSSTPARWTPPLIVMRMNICFPPQEALLPWLPLVVCDAYPRWPGWWSLSLPASMQV